MEESITVRVDKAVKNLMKVTVWANLICIVLFVVVNLVSFLRNNGAAELVESGRRMLSPEILLLLSAVCVIWLLVRTFAVLRTARRMENVHLTIEGRTVSGVSLPEPAAASRQDQNGVPFSLEADAIIDVYSKEVTVIKKQLAPALFIKTDNDTYVLPGLDSIPAVKSRLLRLMDEASDSTQL